jgi:phosphate acetyltransferase
VTANLYITGMERGSGKSVVALGLMETLAGRAQRAGFFRPIVPAGDGRDAQTELVRRRYMPDASYEEMHAVSAAEADSLIAAGRQAELEQRVFDAYKELERSYDVVLCEGTDFAGATSGLDFELNASLANQLGCPVLVVVRGQSVAGIASAVRVARGALERRGCTLFGVIVNRVPPALMAQMREHSVVYDPGEPLYVLPENESLDHPTVAQVADELGAEVLAGDAASLQLPVREVRVAAMSVEHFIDTLTDGTLVIVPGDRGDILLACLAAPALGGLPSVAGIVLTAGIAPSPTITELLRAAPFPTLQVEELTYETAAAVHAIHPVITAQDDAKVATAIGVFQAGVDPEELTGRIALPRLATRTPMMFQYELLERARAHRSHIVLPEGTDERVLRAADMLLRRDVVDLTILGDEQQVRALAATLGLDLGRAEIVDPITSQRREELAAGYHELRKHKGVTTELAFDAVADVSYFGTMLVHSGAADGMVSGAAHTTADTIRPAFEIIKARPEVSVVSSVFFMCLADRVLVYGDCAVNPHPTAEQLADIAASSASTAQSFGIDARIAMLSYSTGSSGSGARVEAVREATALVRERHPDLKVEGPIQYDAAVDAHVAQLKLPGSEVAGRATVFVFPDLDTGNVAYKAVQRSSGAVAIGPVLQGLRRPINDLSRGCAVVDIVNTVAITAIQGQEQATPAAAALTPVG